MRIVHTSDWHAGRIWKGIKRLPELEAVLDDLADFVERERIDLVLHAGDVFDSGIPSADAERAVFRFFKRVGQSGTHTVVIAGNHDSPSRLEAWGQLTELVNVYIVHKPCDARHGGLRRILVRSGETAVVAALPFAAPRFLVDALDQAGQDDSHGFRRYAEGVRDLTAHLAAQFDPAAVNLLVAHTHLEGAAFSGSERRVHIGEEWAADPHALPAAASYVALGHIHRPQAVVNAPAPTVYAGSPLQLDFGEAGEEKSFVVVEAQPGLPVRLERVPYRGGKPLVVRRATLPEVEAEAERLRDAGWLKVILALAAPDPDINTKVRRLLPNVVAVEVELPAAAELPPGERPPADAAPADHYAAYCRRAHGADPEPELLEVFRTLYESQTSEGAS